MKSWHPLLVLLLPLSVSAASLHYADMDGSEWFADEVEEYVQQGYLDSSQQTFRAGDKASRGEFAKMIVMISGGVLDETPLRPSFNDVNPSDWWHPYLEEVAREGWMLGDKSCYGKRPCTMRPADSITRAEAAAVMVRSFGKKATNGAPGFTDNPGGEWYRSIVQIAADHCILRGDPGTRNVRPLDSLNRAEMIVMLYRLDERKVYPNCE